MDRTFGGSYDHIVKIKLVGDSGVGKSCIVLRFCDDQFNQNMMPTIGVDYRTRIFDIQNGQKAKAIIWDTAGQERFKTITSNYYRGSHAIIFAFDVTNRSTFESVTQWMKEAREYFPEPDSVVFMLIGNKVDLVDARDVTKAEAEDFARKNGMMFIETSAKEKTGVYEAFEEVVNKVVESPKIYQAAETGGGKTRKLETPQPSQKDGGCQGYCF